MHPGELEEFGHGQAWSIFGLNWLKAYCSVFEGSIGSVGMIVTGGRSSKAECDRPDIGVALPVFDHGPRLLEHEV
jgi:hypothetical protein